MYSMKKKLKDGAMVLGTFISEVRNPNIAYLLAQCGFDFFVVDNEHGTYGHEAVSNIIAAARGAGIAVIVRVPEIRREAIMKPLDSGASGLLVPMVDTPEQAREIVRLAKYPPAGNRGAALRRAHNVYARVDAVEYLAKANNDTFLAVQAESREAIENADAIAAVEGIDCIFAGPFDLSVSLGIPGQMTHPREIEAIDRMLAACQKHNKAGGVLAFDAESLKPWIAKGMQFVAYSSDINMLADAASSAVCALKGCAPAKSR